MSDSGALKEEIHRDELREPQRAKTNNTNHRALVN